MPLDSTSYLSGFADGSVAPKPIAEIMYSPAVTYYIDSTNGNDSTGKGTQAAPYKTFNRANQDAAKFQATNPNALVALALACGNAPCMESVGGKAVTNRLYTCWKQSGVEDMALMGAPNPFVFIAGGQNVAIKGMRIVAPSTNQANNTNGILFNGPSGVAVTFCDVVGYGINICFTGTGKQAEFVCENNYIAASWLPMQPAPAVGLNWRSQGIYTDNTINPTVQGNVFYKNGYRPGDIVMANKQTWAQFPYSHGWYAHEEATGGPNIDSQNIYWANATTGPQLRLGGLAAWDVFAYNGNACDVYGGGSGFVISDSVILGFPKSYNPNNFPGWGGGVEISSQVASAARLLFLSNNTNYGSAFPPTPLTFHNAPAPGASAVATDITGIWPNLASGGVSNTGYKITTSGINLRLPKPTDVLPDMLSFAGANSEDSGAEILRLNKHNPSRYGAVAAVNYFRRAFAAMT